MEGVAWRGRGVGWQGREGPDTSCYSVVLQHCTYQLYSHTSLTRTKLCAITPYEIQNTINKWKPILDMEHKLRDDIHRKKIRLNGHCPFGGGVDPCPFVLVLFLILGVRAKKIFSCEG